jgi:Photosynthetic reaction centre cytochrome C subunit
MLRRFISAPTFLASLVLALASPALAAPQSAPPPPPSAVTVAAPPAEAPPQNLKVLPKDWTRRQVIDVMKTWTGDLGIRCQHCHVGEEGQPFSEWDFAADEKPTKQRAREMLQMLEEINRRLGAMANLHGTGVPSPLATCGTCHRGLPRPRRIEDVFEETRATQGLAAALGQYRDLRRGNLTRGTYDFSIRPLSVQARRLLQAKDADGARQVMDLAIEVGLDGLMARLTLVDVALAQGQKDAALAHLDKALTLPLNAAEKEFVLERRAELLGKESAKP